MDGGTIRQYRSAPGCDREEREREDALVHAALEVLFRQMPALAVLSLVRLEALEVCRHELLALACESEVRWNKNRSAAVCLY